MKFERVLKVYWAQYYLFNGFLRSPFLKPINIIMYFKGLNFFTQKKLLFFMENDNFLFLRFSGKQIQFLQLTSNARTRINQFLSRLSSINYTFNEMFAICNLQKILLKTYRGRSLLLKRPSRGQRTRSNWRNSKKMCGRSITVSTLFKTWKATRVEQKKASFFFFKKKKRQFRKHHLPYRYRLRIKYRLNRFFNFF